MMRKCTRAALAGALLVGLAGCAAQGDPAANEANVSIQAAVADAAVTVIAIEVSAADISPPLLFNMPIVNGTGSRILTVPVGPARTLTARAYDASGRLTHEGQVTVDVVRGQNPPVAIPMASAPGHLPVTVVIGTPTIVVYPSTAALLPGQSLAFTAAVTGPTGAPLDVAVEWATSNPSIAAIDPDGVATALRPGTVTVAASTLGVSGVAMLTVEGAVEVCSNGMDDDADGLVDCRDPDCAGDPACGTGGGVGAPCASDAECAGGVCITEAAYDWIGGYCSAPCDLSVPDSCGPNLCLDTTLGPLCFDACAGAAECRPGYVCEPAFGPTGICIPDAPPPPVETACANGMDDDADGLVDCADPDCAADPVCAGGQLPVGAPCTFDLQCAYGLCITEATSAWPGGYCSGLCDLASPGSCGSDACVDAGGAAICVDLCTSDASCRPGYTCQPWAGAAPLACLPGVFPPPPTETACNDGVDNDGDGRTDCADPDCAALPWCGGPVEGSFASDALVPGLIEPLGDTDVYALVNTAGLVRTVSLETFGGAVGSCPNVDTTLTVYDPLGRTVAFNDDGGVDFCSMLAFQLPPLETYFVSVGAFANAFTFPYLLQIRFQ